MRIDLAFFCFFAFEKRKFNIKVDFTFFWHEGQEFAPSYKLSTGKDGAMFRT